MKSSIVNSQKSEYYHFSAIDYIAFMGLAFYNEIKINSKEANYETKGCCGGGKPL